MQTKYSYVEEKTVRYNEFAIKIMKILASRQKNNLKSTMFKILEKAAINDLDKEIDFTCQDKLKNSLLNGFTSLITSVNSP